MANIYLVMGDAGEHDDWMEWQVAAYPKEAQAQRHVDLLRLEAEKVSKMRTWTEREAFRTPLDPNMECSRGSEVHYEITEVALVETVEDFLAIKPHGGAA